MQKPLGALNPSSHSYLNGLSVFWEGRRAGEETVRGHGPACGWWGADSGREYRAQGGLLPQTRGRAGRSVTVRKRARLRLAPAALRPTARTGVQGSPGHVPRERVGTHTGFQAGTSAQHTGSKWRASGLPKSCINLSTNGIYVAENSSFHSCKTFFSHWKADTKAQLWDKE